MRTRHSYRRHDYLLEKPGNLSDVVYMKRFRAGESHIPSSILPSGLREACSIKGEATLSQLERSPPDQSPRTDFLCFKIYSEPLETPFLMPLRTCVIMEVFSLSPEKLRFFQHLLESLSLFFRHLALFSRCCNKFKLNSRIRGHAKRSLQPS